MWAWHWLTSGYTRENTVRTEQADIDLPSLALQGGPQDQEHKGFLNRPLQFLSRMHTCDLLGLHMSSFLVIGIRVRARPSVCALCLCTLTCFSFRGHYQLQSKNFAQMGTVFDRNCRSKGWKPRCVWLGLWECNQMRKQVHTKHYALPKNNAPITLGL